MLHLHSEGIVHGDLKAANVLLTAGNANSAAISAHQQLLQLQEQQEQREQREQQQQQQQQQADGASGSHAASCVDGSNGSSSTAGWSSLVAKVGDFGLAVMQAPTDTHATMLARGTPTHMSPELFLAGHVSKVRVGGASVVVVCVSCCVCRVVLCVSCCVWRSDACAVAAVQTTCPRTQHAPC
jgi:serine/threonine protein kinase